MKRPRGPRSSLAPALGTNLQTRALVYYLNHHLQTPPEIQKLLGSVQDSVCQWAAITRYTIIDLAISSMALAVFSRTQRHPPAAIQACEIYGRLIRTAQSTIPALARKDVDAALLTVFLMSRYEDTVQAHDEITSTTAFKSYSHHDGAAAVLQLWHERCLKRSQPASDVIKHSRRGIIRSALLRHMAVPAGLENGSLFGEHGLELEYDQLLVGIASLRNQLRRLQQEILQRQFLSPELASWARDLKLAAEVLSKALLDWAARVPSAWQPRRYLIPAYHSVPRRHFFSSIVYSYPSIAHAAIWLNYLATNMLFNRARLRILELVRPFSDDLAGEQQRQEEYCCSQIRSMSDVLSSSIPFALDRFTLRESSNSLGGQAINLNLEEHIKPYLGNLTAWPLSLASSIGGLDAEQRNWFKSEMIYAGKAVGAAVLEDAHAYNWLDL